MSQAPVGGHPSAEEVDALLDLEDGGLDERVRSHVASCPECTELLKGMCRVRELLRASGAVAPELPPELDARLTAALAQASAERAGTIVPLERARGRRGRRPTDQRVGVSAVPGRVPRWLTVAAGLAVLAGAGTAATQLLDGSGREGSASLARSGDGSPEVTTDAGAGAPGAPGVTSSGTDYTAAALTDQVTGLLDRGSEPGRQPLGSATDQARPDGGPRREGAADATEASRLADPAALDSCVRALGAGGQTPLAVDIATWEGEDATVLVLSDAHRPDAVQVWVVGPGCGRNGDELLHYQVVRR